MTTDGTTAGWYGDPGGSGGLRWWDGQEWTEHVSPAASPAQDEGSGSDRSGTGGPGFAPQPPGFAGQQPGWGGQQPGFGGQQPGFGGQQPGFGGQQPGFGGRPPRTAWAANRYAYISSIVSIAYLLLAISTHFVLIGILPLLMSVRSMRARERLAPVALGLSVVVIVVSIGVLAHH